MSVSYDFSGKAVLITGSSSGIGAGIAVLFAKSGADLVITGRNNKNLSEVAKSCREASTNKLAKIVEVVADLTVNDDIKRLVNITIENFGKLDVLVNNAGINRAIAINQPKYMDIHTEVLNTNLNSIVYLTHLCIEYLVKTKGNIINISSVGGLITAPYCSSYCMSKAALDMFTKCMASELGKQNIRINGINLGVIRTPMLLTMGVPEEKSVEYLDNYNNLYPIGRPGEPEDVANMVLFLASDRSSFITGSNVTVDGGHIAANVNQSLND